MQKTILVTGSTDGIGLETSKILISMGNIVLLHGRNSTKLEQIEKTLSALSGDVCIESYVADLSCIDDVETLAKKISEKHIQLDVLINNAGVYSTPNPVTQDGLDIRFVVNTIAPYLLTKRLLPLMGTSGRVINLSSAAQSTVDQKALTGQNRLSNDLAYAQSKLALTMWSRNMALTLKDQGPSIITVNPRSMLGSKMVKQAYGIDGYDLRIGAEILTKTALSDEFADSSGKYFDNDIGQFAWPHPDALNPQKCQELIDIIETILAK